MSGIKEENKISGNVIFRLPTKKTLMRSKKTEMAVDVELVFVYRLTGGHWALSLGI